MILNIERKNIKRLTNIAVVLYDNAEKDVLLVREKIFKNKSLNHILNIFVRIRIKILFKYFLNMINAIFM